MNGVEPSTALDNDANSVVSSAAETKRRAARRRFLARGTAAGSGLLIVTLYHQRSFANGTVNKIYVSSAEFCHSLRGTKVQVKDVVTSFSNGKKVSRVECQL